MADNILRELLAFIGIEGDEDAKKALDAVDDAFDTTKERAEDLAGTLTALVGAFAAVGAAAVAQAIDTGAYAQRVEQQAAAVGLTTDRYQELAYAAERANVPVEDTAKVLSKIGVSAAAAVGGSKDIAGAFHSLGLDAATMAKLSPDARINALADALAHAHDPSTRLTASVKILGDELAAKVIPLLSQGSAGLAKMGKAAHDMGYVLDRDALAQADAFNASVRDLDILLTSVRNRVGLDVIPALSDLADRFLRWYDVNRDVIDQRIDLYAGRVADGFLDLADAVERLDRFVSTHGGWEAWVTTIGELAAAGGVALVAYRVVALGSALLTAGKAAWTLALPLREAVEFIGAFGWDGFVVTLEGIAAALAPLAEVAVPVLAVAAAFVALAFALEDAYRWLNGGDSVIGRLLARWPELAAAIAAVSQEIRAMIDLTRALWGLAEAAWGAFARAATPALQAVADELGPVADLVERLLGLLARLPGPGGLINAGLQGATVGAFGNAAATGTTTAAIDSYAASLRGYAPTASSAGAGVSRSTVVQGDTWHITGVGMSKDDVDALIAQRDAEKHRDALATITGTDV